MARKKRKTGGWQGKVLLVGCAVVGVVFSAVSMILAIGMVPTFVCALVDRTKGKMRAITVGCINFAGCAPFMMDVYKRGNNFEAAISLIVQPKTIVIMYFAAALGYLIDWAMTGIVSSIMVQKAKNRLNEIERKQKILTERWGPEVTGAIPLDEFGFPKEITPQADEFPA